MKSIKHIARNSLHNLGDAATKRAIKQFTTKYHFVYFGHVDPREDEYELVRGITVSTTHTDNHYTVGSYNSHDIILVERRNTLSFPGKQDSTYRWLIMQIDLKRTGLPHVFIDCHHHDAVFYANAFAAHGVPARAMSLDPHGWVITDGRGRFLADGGWVEDPALALAFRELWAAVERQQAFAGIVLPWATAMQVGVHHEALAPEA